MKVENSCSSKIWIVIGSCQWLFANAHSINFESDKFSIFFFVSDFPSTDYGQSGHRLSGVSLFPLSSIHLATYTSTGKTTYFLKILEVFIKIRLCIWMPKKSPLKFYLTQTPKCGSSVLSIELLIFVPKLEFPFLLRLIVRALWSHQVSSGCHVLSCCSWRT